MEVVWNKWRGRDWVEIFFFFCEYGRDGMWGARECQESGNVTRVLAIIGLWARPT